MLQEDGSERFAGEDGGPAGGEEVIVFVLIKDLLLDYLLVSIWGRVLLFY